MPRRSEVGFEHTLTIDAPPDRVLNAFFDARALAAWWQAKRAVTTPRPLGVYALEWEPTPFADELLGRLGGVFHGIVVDHEPGTRFFVGNAYWLPPDSDPVGPMALTVTCAEAEGATRLLVQQSGYEESARWRRYYLVIAPGWTTSLAALKRYLESGLSAEEARPLPRLQSRRDPHRPPE